MFLKETRIFAPFRYSDKSLLFFLGTFSVVLVLQLKLSALVSTPNAELVSTAPNNLLTICRLKAGSSYNISRFNGFFYGFSIFSFDGEFSIGSSWWVNCSGVGVGLFFPPPFSFIDTKTFFHTSFEKDYCFCLLSFSTDTSLFTADIFHSNFELPPSESLLPKSLAPLPYM